MLRFAAAPTEELSLNDLRVALLTYLAARKRGDKFVVRIEEGDKTRNVEGKDQEILDILALFGVSWDDLHYQSRNLTIHQQLTVKLLSSRNAFACFCTPEELEDDHCARSCEKLSDAEVLSIEKPFCIRIKKPESPIEFDDILRGRRVFTPDAIDSFVILKIDKIPTRDFACAVDDMLLDADLIIRHDDESLETARQIHVRRRLGYDRKIEYVHLPPVLGQKGERLPGVKALLQQGFFPEAIADFLIETAMKKWTAPSTLEEAVVRFDLENLSTESVRYDIERLRDLNRAHMKRMDAKELSRAFGFADAAVGELVKCHIGQAATVAEIRPAIDAIFAPKPFDGARNEPMRRLRSALKEAPLFDNYDTLEAYLSQKTALEGEALAAPLRRLLTGAEEGPELGKLYPHLKSYLQEIIQ